MPERWKPRPAKIAILKPVVIQCIESGRFRLTRHAIQRMGERKVTQMEILDALRRGRHVKRRDKFDEFYRAWNYAMEGKTEMDSRELRVIVSFDDASQMLIVTVVEPGIEDKS